jgi:PAS domain S-box-containing protein
MKTILIVDDDKTVVKQIRHLLTEFGYVSKFVVRPKNLFPMMEKESFDLILMDINMPEVDGITLLSRLKAHPSYYEIPVIMLTAERSEQIFEDCFDNGAADFIVKPVKEKILKARIKSALAAQDYNLSLQIEIDARKQAEIALNDSRRFLLNLTNQLPGIAYRRYNNEGWSFEYISDGCLRLTGYSVDQLAGEYSYKDLIHPEDKAATVEKITHDLNEQQWFQAVYRIVDASGNEKYVLEKGRGVMSDNGPDHTISAVEGFITDITVQKKAEKQLEEYSNQLEKLNCDKDKFFSILSHDLRSPLTGLLLFSKLLKDNAHTYPKETLVNTASIIHESCESLQNLLESILNWARMQNGKVDFNPDVFNLSSIMSEIFMLFERTAEEKGVTLTSNVHDNVEICADQNMTKLIIRNLISNAIKFSHSGSVIDITTDTGDGFVEVKVSDSGVGMSQSRINTLFKVDQHQSEKGTSGESGSGLGLILCKEMVNKNGGEIWVVSEPGKGSVFHFTLPIPIIQGCKCE